MDEGTAREALKAGDVLAVALRMKASHEAEQHVSVIKMASEALVIQQKLLERTLAMFDGGCASGDLRALLDDIRSNLEAPI